MSSESTVRNALEQLSKAQGYISGLQSTVTKAMTEVTASSSNIVQELLMEVLRLSKAKEQHLLNSMKQKTEQAEALRLNYAAYAQDTVHNTRRLTEANFSLERTKSQLLRSNAELNASLLCTTYTGLDDQAWGVSNALSGVLDKVVLSWPAYPQFTSGYFKLLGVVSNNRVLVFARDTKSRYTTSKVSLPLDCTFEELTQAVTDIHTLVGNK
jgi:hypothetical protein